MARKVWAYAKDKNQCFICENQSLQPKIFYIWDVLRLKEQNFKKYQELKFYSTEHDEINRLELIPTEHGFFRYKSDEIDENTKESIYHSAATLVLLEMPVIKFTFDKNKYILNFSKFLVEPCLRFKHFDQDEEKYYPDLVGYFSSECELQEKWKGCLAIEVVYTNACYSKKIHSFEKNHIPIIEVSISKKLKLETEFGGEIKFTVADVENYYFSLKKIFEKNVYGKIRSDPVNHKFYTDKIISLEDAYKRELENKQLLNDNEKANLKRELNYINLKYEEMKSEASHLHNLFEQMKQQEWHLNNRLNNYAVMGFWQKLKFLFNISAD